MIAVQTNGPYLIHAKGNGVRKLEDMKGLKIRGSTRMINKMIETLGATPVGMPVPSVPDSLSKGVIDGATAAVGSDDAVEDFGTREHAHAVFRQPQPVRRLCSSPS